MSNFNGKIFLNPIDTPMMGFSSALRLVPLMFNSKDRTPKRPLGPFKTDASTINQLPSTALRVTWLGHSSTLIEIDGKRFLTDPLWYQRVSPSQKFGPKRFFANPLPIDQLPPIDAVVLSHDHYDHLDKSSVMHLVNEKKIPVITMLGVGKRLIAWGAPKHLITELNWWDTTELGNNFSITAAPARHFSGRSLRDRFTTLWGSFVIRGPHHRVYYGADSGYFSGFKEIGERLGPFDLTMLEIGAYNDLWKEIHMGPEGAAQVQQDLGSGILMPIHWATFNLAFHPWYEPIEILINEAKKKGIKLLIPRPGETVEVKEYDSGWWREYRVAGNG